MYFELDNNENIIIYLVVWYAVKKIQEKCRDLNAY